MESAEDDNGYTVSHLCHQGSCFNPQHLVLEDLATYKSRNACPGVSRCTHKPLCLIPGQEYGENQDVVVFSPSQGEMIRSNRDSL